MPTRINTPLPKRCLLYQALLWVADGTQPIEDDLFRSASEPVRTGSLDDHKRDLFIALKTGKILAEGTFLRSDGNYPDVGFSIEGINPKYWEDVNLEWRESKLRIYDIFKDEGTFIGITLSTQSLMRVFPVEAYESQRDAANQTISSIQSGPRGRRAKYDWQAFYTEVVVRADLDSLPDIQADLEREMLAWCTENWVETPGESTIRERLAPIYEHKRKASN